MVTAARDLDQSGFPLPLEAPYRIAPDIIRKKDVPPILVASHCPDPESRGPVIARTRTETGVEIIPIIIIHAGSGIFFVRDAAVRSILTMTAMSARLESRVASGMTLIPTISGLFAAMNITNTASVQTKDIRVAFFSVARVVPPSSGTMCMEEPMRSIPTDP